MSYAQNLWIYFILVLGIIIVPGMDMFFVMANGLAGGRARALAATCGVVAGGAFHTLFGAFALSAIVAAAPQLLTLILMTSAVYMAWIGWTLLRSAITVDSIDGSTARDSRKAFHLGFMTCVLNPKAYLFTSAVYPQFIRPEFGPVWAQAVPMGLITALCQLVVYGSLGLATSEGTATLGRHKTLTIWVGRGAGLLFLAVAGLTVVRLV
ncbi:MAG: LysE family translocator [Rhizobiales bacterium]|nr:LysE family translocator [Hyphomicrobiales bacterium]